VLSAELTLVPQNSIEVTDEGEAKKVLRLMDAIDDHDDVQNVYANFDISDEILAAYEGMLASRSYRRPKGEWSSNPFSKPWLAVMDAAFGPSAQKDDLGCELRIAPAR
jgi:hypothetical protein